MDMRIEIGAKLLDVKSEVLSEFEVEDTFNPGNRIAGVICRQSDHRYGALVITSVNGCDVTPQVIYCTPKLHYPFGSSDEGDRTYHWPKDIKRVEVYPKLDGCFAYHTPILLSDGTTIPIGHIVNQDLHPDIWSYNEDTKEVQISRITAGHKYQATKTKVKISFKKVGWQKGPSTLICTSDHKIFTPKGVVDAADLKPGSKAYRFCPILPEPVKQFLVGALLGDSCIRLPSKDQYQDHIGNPSIEFSHGKDQKEYLYLKYKLLKEYARKEPYIRRGGFANTPKWAFGLKSQPALLDLFNQFIVNGKKIIPDGIQIPPLTLAIWFMDDGSVSSLGEGAKQRPRADFHTEGFTQKDTEKLLQVLEETYGLTGSVIDYGKGPVLEIHTDATEKLFNIVAPYITPCMQYKIPERYRIPKSYLDQLKAFPVETGLREVDIINVQPHMPSQIRTTDSHMYDLTIEKTSTYFAGGLLVHNSNLCSYSYADTNGKRFMTFKTRLVPVVQESRFGSFASMWQEILDANPSILSGLAAVLEGKYTVSFEMYGYRNRHLILYPEALDAKMLFFVDQKDGTPYPPSLWSEQHPWMLYSDAVLETPAGLTEFYNQKRDEAEAQNTKVKGDDGDDLIEGMEGFIFYVLDGKGRWNLEKCKPPSIEDIHWTGDTIPLSRIMPTAWNGLESAPDGVLTTEYVRQLLLEEFAEKTVNASQLRIEKAVQSVNDSALWRERVKAAYLATGLDMTKDGKAPVMRTLSKIFTGPEMKRVYSALKSLGVAT